MLRRDALAQEKAAAPAQSADTPFADAAGPPKQQARITGDVPVEAEQSADLESDTASTLAPTLSTFKSEMGDFDSGVILGHIDSIRPLLLP